jgi:transposase InsO family protein
MKWIEYKPIASLTSTKAVEFIQEIMFRFGIPNSIITNLGSNFTSSEFFDFASVVHPRANGQMERANGMILDALRKRYSTRVRSLQGSGSVSYHT